MNQTTSLIPNLDSIHYMVLCPIDIFNKRLENGFNVNKQTDHGTTLLGCLMLRKLYQKIEILLDYDLDLSLFDRDGRTIFFAFINWDFEPDVLHLMNRIISMDVTGDICKHVDVKGQDAMQHYQRIRDQCWVIYSGLVSHMQYEKCIVYDCLLIMFENHFKKTKTLFSLMFIEINE